MKTKLLSLLIPALLAAGSAQAAEIFNKDGNKLDLYGKVDGLHYFSDNDDVDGDKTYIRLGIKGETQIADPLMGYGQWEYQVQGNNDESHNDAWTRVAFAGLKVADVGSFDYGRNYGVMYDVGAWTDMLPEYGGDTYGTDNFLFSRGNGMATYRNTDFFGLVNGLDFALQYQGKNGSARGEDEGGRSVVKQNGDGYGASIRYDMSDFLPGVSVGAAMMNSKRSWDQQNGIHGDDSIYGHGDRAEAYSGGIKYDANDIYLAAMFTQSYNATRFGDSKSRVYGFANKAQNVEIVAQYQFDFGLRPSVAYLQSRGKKLEGYSDQDLLKYVEVGTTYYFNKNMSTYVDYKINLIDKNDFNRGAKINTDNVVALGLVYQF